MIRNARTSAWETSPSKKAQEDITSVEDVDLGAERAEGATVFSADHTRTDDRQDLGNAVQLQDRIGIVNFAVTGLRSGRGWQFPSHTCNLLAHARSRFAPTDGLRCKSAVGSIPPQIFQRAQRSADVLRGKPWGLPYRGG